MISEASLFAGGIYNGAMDLLLTTKEVIDILKVDRTTIYRMLKDGRLTGVKIGREWRFYRGEVEALISGQPLAGQHEYKTAFENAPQNKLVFPLPCVQMIQDVFAELAEVGVITTASTGDPLTEISSSSGFCNLILNSETGRQGCIHSWRRLAENPVDTPEFVRCHAGLQYARARIDLNKEFSTMLIAGQFYADPPSEEEETPRLKTLAEKYDLDPKALKQEVQNIPVLNLRKRAQIGKWLERVAQSFSEIAQERAELMGRLEQIAAISELKKNS